MSVSKAETIDRPSAKQLKPPDYQSTESPEGFVLPPVPEANAANSNVSRILFIQRIILKGNTLDLSHLTQPYHGRRVSIAELESLRQKVTQFYIDKGYVNSGAVISADAYRDGELHIDIVEGKLDEVRLKGLGRLREGYVKNRLLPNPEKPFNLQELQENYQLLLSDPLISRMNGRILPGATPGHSILDVDVTRALPYQLSLFGNNQRPPSIGAEAFGVNGVVRNLTGLGDTLDFNFTISEGSKRYAGGLALPLSDMGTQAFFRFDEGDSLVIEAPFKAIDIKSQVHNLEGGISHPLINTLNQYFSMGAMLAVRVNETSGPFGPISFVPGITSARNQSTVVRLFQEYNQRWERHVLALRSSFSIGIDALGATPEHAVNYPDSEFFAWLGQGQYAWRLFDNGAQAVLRGNLQLSNEALLPQERMAVGGFYTVRGYRENQLVRDQGYSLSAEFHYPLWGGTDANARHRLTIVPFMDYGRAWNHGEGSLDLHSVGIGLDWQFKPAHASLYYGYAINAPQSGGDGNLQDDGLHFQVGVDVF